MKKKNIISTVVLVTLIVAIFAIICAWFNSYVQYEERQADRRHKYEQEMKQREKHLEFVKSMGSELL